MILDETWATSKNLEVTVISGNQLPTSKRDMIDPYIVIEVLTPNQSFGEFKTKTIKVCLATNVMVTSIKSPTSRYQQNHCHQCHDCDAILNFSFRIMVSILISKQLSKLVKLGYQKFLF